MWMGAGDQSRWLHPFRNHKGRSHLLRPLPTPGEGYSLVVKYSIPSFSPLGAQAADDVALMKPWRAATASLNR